MFKWWKNYKHSKFLLKEAQEKNQREDRQRTLKHDFLKLLEPEEKTYYMRGLASLFKEEYEPDTQNKKQEYQDSAIVHNLKKIIREEIAAVAIEKKIKKK